MERRLLQLQSESSQHIRQLSDEITHLQEDKACLEERLKIAISSLAPLRSMATSSSPPSLYGLSNEADSKHSTRRNDRVPHAHSSPNSPVHSDDSEVSFHGDTSAKFSRHALLSLERRAALAEASLKQAELREAAAAESYASQLLAANSAKEDEAAACEELRRELHLVSESRRQLMLQVDDPLSCNLCMPCPSRHELSRFHIWCSSLFSNGSTLKSNKI
jgi:DNA repair exonuclease SbcCD ATPase subunit